jgi:hypothetical protein
MNNHKMEQRLKMEHNREKISNERILMGSTKGKYPVVLDNGRTTIYISDKSKEMEVRMKYEKMRNN